MGGARRRGGCLGSVGCRSATGVPTLGPDRPRLRPTTLLTYSPPSASHPGTVFDYSRLAMTVPTAPGPGLPPLLAGRYELQERLGAGGMAEVWLARDTLLARPVAVKLLDRRLAADPRLVEQFKREAQSAAILNHPNIVAVYDWGRVSSSDDRPDDT